jgi:O-antigen ligase
MPIIDRVQCRRLADFFALALAISLPWSTSATGICAILLLLAIVPIIDPPAFEKIIFSPAGGIPLALVALGLVGLLWAQVPWAERLNGISSYLKLIYIPLLLYHFSRSDCAHRILIGFLASCAVLLFGSWAFVIWPELQWRWRPGAFAGVPVKDYVSQSAMFTISIFVMVQFGFDSWRCSRRYLASAFTALALIFLVNIFFVATSRTSLVVIPIILGVFCFRNFGWKGTTALMAGFVIVIAVAWQSGNYLQERVDSMFAEIQSFRPDGPATSAGERLVFWQKSIGFIKAAPIIGHGTGSIREQFKRSAIGQTGMAAEVSTNPHNQILAVGIQLGFVGIAVLLAMWAAHLALFQSNSFAPWVGLVVVIQNVVGSLFNSHLFDFTHGWTYVVGVGVAGGIALKERAALIDRDSIMEEY